MKKITFSLFMVCIAGIILAQKTPGVRINAGDTANYIDTKGNIWFADAYSDAAGNHIDRGNITIAGTNDPRIYQTERYCMNNYNIPIVNGTYTVNLLFAETNGDAIGQRVFDVNVGGQSLNNLDVRAQAGDTNKALIKTFTNVNVTNGYLLITFTQHAGSDCPEINGIEIPIDSIPHPPVEPIPALLFGMHAYYASSTPPYIKYGATGKGACTGWASLEPSRGVFDWYDLDYFVNKATQLGQDAMWTFYGVPSWTMADTSTCGTTGCPGNGYYCPVKPDNLTDVDVFYDSLCARYCGTALKYIELANEPYGEMPDPQDMADIASHAYKAIRKACPAMKIISPDMCTGINSPSYYEGYFEKYFADGGPTWVDIASIHAYAEYTGSNGQPEQIIPGGYLYDNRLVNIINTYLPGKPVWNTEGSWGTATSDPEYTTPAQQAAFVARWHILHWSSGFSRMYWYGWDLNYGTLDSTMAGSNIQATAYTQTYNWLVGATMPSSCVESADSTWTCGLTRPGSYQGLIVWNTTGNRSYNPPNPSTWSRYRDLAGDTIPYLGGAVTIGIQPILFENTGSATGINKISAKDEVIKISPNPARDKIYFETSSSAFSEVSIGIYSIEGKLLINKNLNLQTEKMMDVSSLASGIYFVRFTNDKINQNQKIIIVK